MKRATRDAYGTALAKIIQENKNIVVLDADLSKSTKSAEAKKVAPDRHFNIGIAEANMMGIAAGLATCGNTVFASTFAMFATGRAYDQIRNSICYPNLNVKVCATHSGLTVGEDGASHQTVEDLALMRVIPNMHVFCPCDGVETEHVIRAVAELDGPCYVRLGRPSVEDIFDETYQFEIGKGVTLKEGNDVTLVCTGFETGQALQAAEELEKDNIHARVIHIHTIKPIDQEILVKAAKETGLIITCEEHSIYGGLGSAVSEVVSEQYPCKVVKVGIQDTFGESGKPMELIEKYGLSAQHIVTVVKEQLSK
ncbi:transketolase family protein [Filifactor alocis]|uniref:transketolase family protein n=1 Tax=Filifactor alocis TaxID=143361 RepID=UPI0023565708|nr:transketolase family protein [Filifactor alocis]